MDPVTSVASPKHDQDIHPVAHDHLQPCDEVPAQRAPPVNPESLLGPSSHNTRPDDMYGLLELAAKAHGHGSERAAQGLVDVSNGHVLKGLTGLAISAVEMRVPGAKAVTTGTSLAHVATDLTNTLTNILRKASPKGKIPESEGRLQRIITAYGPNHSEVKVAKQPFVDIVPEKYDAGSLKVELNLNEVSHHIKIPADAVEDFVKELLDFAKRFGPGR